MHNKIAFLTAAAALWLPRARSGTNAWRTL